MLNNKFYFARIYDIILALLVKFYPRKSNLIYLFILFRSVLSSDVVRFCDV